MESTSCVVYIVLKTHSSVKLEYSKSNGLIVYNLNNNTYLYIMIEIGYNFLKKD